MKYQAAIFDMDGVLVDSELYWQSYESQIYQRLGLNDNREFRKKLAGLSIGSIARLLKNEYGAPISEEELAGELNRAAQQIYRQQCALLPGVLDFLTWLQENSVQLALASVSPQNWIDMARQRFNLDQYFPLIFSGHSLGLPAKPDPAIFVTVMEEMGIRPESAVIFEDSHPGVLAGVRSGAAVIAVRDGRWETGENKQANLVIKSFREKKLRDFLSL